jgi:propionyl-CoA carboxylase beta chain
MDMAVKMGAPMMSLNDSGGAYSRRSESLGSYADIFFYQCANQWCNSSNIGNYGTLRWWAVYSPAMTDFTMMVEDTSYMFVTGEVL